MSDRPDTDANDDAKVDISRRKFFKGVGIVGAGAAVADLIAQT
jgi:hypothetical protein